MISANPDGPKGVTDADREGYNAGMAQMQTPTFNGPRVVALIVAAGRGVRAGRGLPKQYRQLADSAVLTHTLRAFLECGQVSVVQVVIHSDDVELYRLALGGIEPLSRVRVAEPAFGGSTRMETVRNGLAALDGLADPDDVVLIHDAARPFVSPDLIANAASCAALHGAAVPVLPVTDTVKRVDADGRVTETVDRDTLRTVQTPQAFRLGLIRAAHAAAVGAGRQDATDDGGLVEWAGLPLATFPGDLANVKLTTADDVVLAQQRMAAGRAMLTRVATGYDVHAFGQGDHVWICGVRIPHSQGVVAHSDGDVALHALSDAIFGVIGDGDIGLHFPPSDARWRGAPSDQFLAFACGRLKARGGVIDHLDVTLVCERPKIGPHREAMLNRLAEIAAVRLDQIGLKATTSEGLGFTGRSEGLAAFATVTVRLPEAKGEPYGD